MAEKSLPSTDDDQTEDLSPSAGSTSCIQLKLDSILKEIEHNLPSLDDGDSDFEEESGDEMEIFQRPESYGHLLTEDADKDLDESLTSSDFGDKWAWKPANYSQTTNVSNLPENDELDEGVGIYRNTSSDIPDSPQSRQQSDENVNQREASPVFSCLELHTPPQSSPLDDNGTQSHSFTFSPRSATTIQSPATSPRQRRPRPSRPAAKRGQRSSVKLSLGALEGVDLDLALQNVIEAEYAQERRSRSSSIDLFDLKPGESAVTNRDPNRSADLMQKLVGLSSRESGVKLDIDPISGADRSIPQGNARAGRAEVGESKYELDQRAETVKYEPPSLPRKSARTSVTGVGTSTSGTNTGQKVLAPRPPEQRFGSAAGSDSGNPPRDTVFIDLRKSTADMEEEKNKLAVVQRVLKLNKTTDSDTGSSSDSSSENEREDWFTQRQKIRRAIVRGEAVPPPEEKRKYKLPKRSAHQPPRPRQLAMQTKSSAVKSSSGSSTETGLDGSSPTLTNNESKEIRSQSTDKNVIEESNELEKQRKEETAALILKKKREADKLLQLKEAKRQKLISQCPTTSVDGKRAAAKYTPVLFHLESSYEKPLLNLPSNIHEHEGTTLLTINLSSNGEIMAHRSPASKSFDKTADTWSVSYLALVTWLCSLIPKDIERKGDDTVPHPFPFNVLGLQQMVFNDKLLLVVVIVPVCQFSGKAGRKGNKKHGGQSTFHSIINRFLATNNLSSVTPWLSGCVSQTISSVNPETQYRYTPPQLEVTTKPLSTFIQVNTNPDAVLKYFGAPISCYWQTVRNEETSYFTDDELESLDGGEEVQNTLVLIYKNIYREPMALFAVLGRLLQNGLDISGLRLATPQLNLKHPSVNVGPVLAIGIRGTLARPIWLEELGPMDPQLARQTDPNSLIALFGGDSRETMTLFTPRNSVQITEEMVRWFGGRPDTDSPSPSLTSNSTATSTEMLEDSFTTITRICPVSLLTATVTADIFVVVSHLLPIRYVGVLLATCQRRGYLLKGVRRRRLTQKQASVLAIKSDYSEYFTVDYTAIPTSPRQTSSAATNALLGAPSYCYTQPPKPGLILHLSKENALHNSASLIENFMVQLTLLGLLDDCENAVGGNLTSAHLFHITSFSESLLAMLGGNLSKVPLSDAPASTGYIFPKLHVNAELEQISVLTLTGKYQMASYILLIARLLGVIPHHNKYQKKPTVDPSGLELLGIKWVPSLHVGQAKELTPYEVGHPEWKSSIKELTSKSALVLVLRGLDCSKRIKDLLPQSPQGHRNNKDMLTRILSPTPELAYRLSSLFFFDRELFADNSCRHLLDYLPPVRTEIKSPADTWEDEQLSSHNKRPKSGRSGKTPPRTPPKTPPQNNKYTEESIFKTMLMGPRPIVTVLIIKPSALKRNNLARLLRGALLERFEIVGLRLVQFTELEAACLQSAAVKRDDKLYKDDLEHMTSHSSLILALTRENAVKRLLDVLGPEDSVQAKKLDPFLWRAMYGSDLVNNGFYASTSYAAAVRDLKRFFPDGLCCQTTVDLTADGVMSPGVDSRLCRSGRVAKEQVIVDTGPYNLLRLAEVNCLVLHSPLIRTELGTKDSKLTDIIQCLQAVDVKIVGARMVWLTESQAQDYLHVINAGSFAQVPLLTAAPLLVLAIQCDHAVISFNYVFESGMTKIGRPKEDYIKYIHVEKDKAGVERLLAYFFDSLVDNCKVRITEKVCHQDP